jgi:ABC-type amino acid transport substrate-binding protein
MIIRQLLLLFFISIFSTASGTITLSQDEQAYLKEKKEIKVCISPKGLPLFDYKEGQNIGILPEIMFLLEKKIPIPVHYIPIKTWEECIRLTKEKKADISTMILASPNRHTHLIPTHKVIEGSIGIATKINEQLHNDLAEISFKKVALLNGQTSISQYVKHNFPNLTIVMVDSIEEGLKMVIKGKVYGYVDETFSLAYHILRLHSNELKIIDRMNKTPLHGSLGIRKDEPQLLNIMNKAIDSTDEQEIRDIVHHWISVRVEKKIDYTLLVAIVSVFLLILLVSLYLIKLKQTEQQNLYLAELVLILGSHVFTLMIWEKY